MIATMGLTHIALPARDPERSARFYMDLFGMEALWMSADAAFLSTPGRSDLLALSRSEILIESSRDTMHFGFMVDADQFDEALRMIGDRSITIVAGPDERETGRYVFIEDPEGYTVEIFEFVT